MPETPPPQPLVDDLENTAEADASRPRRRSNDSNRPVSTVAPARTSNEDDADADAGTLTAEDCAFVTALHEAGIASELDGAELTRSAALIRNESGPARRLDLLEAYYEAGGDPLASQRRTNTDRFMLYAMDDGLTASELAERLLALTPEIRDASLERIGGRHGALVLRAGDHLCALEDEHEDDKGLVTVSVRELVRAVNVLLDRCGVRMRLVGLAGDGAREAYFAQTSMGSALQLANADYLDAEDAETLMQRAAW